MLIILCISIDNVCCSYKINLLYDILHDTITHDYCYNINTYSLLTKLIYMYT